MGPPTGGASSRRSPAGCRRGGVTASSAELAGSSRRSRSSGSGTRRSRTCADARVVDEATCDWLAGYRFSGDVSGYAEGEVYFPGSPVLVVESSFAEGVVLETLVAVDPQPRHGDRVGRLADDRRRRRPAVHRDGLPANARGGRGRGRPRRLHRGLRDDEQPRGRPSLRGTHGRHRGARVHPRARLGTRGLRGPGGQSRARDHPARRHLRRPRGGSHRGRGGRDVARRGPARLGRPAGAGAAGPRPARLARGHRHADRRHVRPRRVCDRLARVRAGRRLRGGDAAGDRFGCTHREHGLQARLAIRRRRGDAAGREAERVEDLGRWPQVGAAPALPRRGGGGRGRRYRGAPHGRRGRPRADGRPGPRGRAAGPAGPRPPPGNDTWPRAPSCRPAPCGCSAARSPSRRCSRTGTAAET